MQSGDLSHRIEFQAQVKTPDGMGGFTTVWQAIPNFSSIYASIWGISGKEQVEGGRTIPVASKRVRIRYKRGFKTSWRGKDLCHFNGTYLSIVTAPVDIGDRHEYLEFYCKEVTG